jgi:hypothetical protein
MLMTMRNDGNGRVSFDSHLVQETPVVQAMPVWDRQALRSTSPDALITACGWCKRLKLDDHWREAEEAISASGLFNRAVLPQLTHGICPSCYASVLDVLEAS